MSSDLVLELRNVSKAFATHRAVDNVSLAVKRGELHALLGPSGCGKTTTLRMVAGFETPTQGEILLSGQDIAQLKPYERNVSTVFQSYALFPHLTVRENIEFGLRQKGISDRKPKIDQALDLVQLTHRGDHKPPQMSGGEKQRAALARSLVLEPEVLLLDEPLSALDPNLRKQVRAELKALQRRVGTTFLMVTHDQEEALSMSDRITLMNKGRVEQIGTPEEIYLKPRTAFTAGFLGAMNWVDGVGVRPECTFVAEERPGNGEHWRSAVVKHSTFLGDCLQVEAEIPGGASLVAQVSRLNGRYHPGQPVHVWWHAHDELRLE